MPRPLLPVRVATPHHRALAKLIAVLPPSFTKEKPPEIPNMGSLRSELTRGHPTYKFTSPRPKTTETHTTCVPIRPVQVRVASVQGQKSFIISVTPTLGRGPSNARPGTPVSNREPCRYDWPLTVENAMRTSRMSGDTAIRSTVA